ncbi:uncharacterized protein LOC144151713 [Haemaphysalis longicornis]
MKLLFLLWVAVVTNEAFTPAAHGPGGAHQFGLEGTQGATPYRFSYDTSGAGGAFHQEVGDALGNKRGFYGLPGRRVYYIADEGGFRASVGSNEPGVDISKDPADVVFTGSPNSGPVPLPPPSPSSEATGDDGLVFPPPYAGGGSDSNDFGDQGEKPGDVDGNKDGGNGLKDTDGGTPTNEADAGGFPGTGEPNEPGVHGAIDPVDLDVTKRLQPAGIALVYFGPPGSPPSGARLLPPRLFSGGPGVPAVTANGGFPFTPVVSTDVHIAHGQRDQASVDTKEPRVEGAQGPADVAVNKGPGHVGHTPVAADGGVHGAPGAEDAIPAAPLTPALVGPPTATAPNPPSLSGVLGFPGLPGFAGFPPGSVITSPPLGPAGGPNFDYNGGGGGGFHQDTGGAGTASVQGNRPNVDNFKSPVDASLSSPGGVQNAQAVSGQRPPQPQLPAIPANQGVGGLISRQGLPAPGGLSVVPWLTGGYVPLVSLNPTPGSFFYETKVLGPQHSVVKFHQY